jgi:hypothetical protein
MCCLGSVCQLARLPLVPHHLLRFHVPQGRDLLLKAGGIVRYFLPAYRGIPTQELG